MSLAQALLDLGSPGDWKVTVIGGVEVHKRMPTMNSNYYNSERDSLRRILDFCKTAGLPWEDIKVTWGRDDLEDAITVNLVWRSEENVYSERIMLRHKAFVEQGDTYIDEKILEGVDHFKHMIGQALVDAERRKPVVPDLIEHVVGYREWRLDETAGFWKLLPIGSGSDVWRGGEPVKATCAGSGKAAHISPSPDCECGLYHLHVPPERSTTGNVIGLCRAWGRMEVHERGFRSEYSQPVLLAFGTATQFLRLECGAAQQFDLPTCAVEDLPARAEQFGKSIPREFFPKAK